MFHVVVGILLFVIYMLITSVGEERANFSAINCSYLCGFCSENLPLPPGA